MSVLILLIIFTFFAFIRHLKELKKYHQEHPEEAKIYEEKKKIFREKRNDYFYGLGVLVGIGAIFIGIFSSIIILGFQILKYLKTGNWSSLSLIDIMRYYEVGWAEQPHDWFGLWYALNSIHISIIIFLICTLIVIGLITLKNLREK
ncbi:hypothetical protein TUM19329_19200 [Legionella antarctica]|uniref:Transmembrane protein n=1 Tax=Legionella antarctica TaxID=2708020 RepID=A0A6F8T534_9GAMM|nr:hypothetical protein [Legionella antarctica]BCA95559.1 hypothetical protein TUM19329_19200 [Legionella antarctica]